MGFVKRLMALCFFSGGALLTCGAAAQKAHDAPPRGVWEGTLGENRIAACFNGENFGGSYYYLKFLKPIQLAQNNDKGPWYEEGRTGSWRLNPPSGDRLTGTWVHPKTGKMLPLELKLVDGANENLACSRDSYNARIEAPPEVKAGKTKKRRPHSWRNLQFAEQQTVEILDAGEPVKKINLQLRQVIDTSEKRVHAYYQTRRKFLSLSGVPAKDDLTAEPVYWSSQWLSIRFHRWLAGEGREGISGGIKTWDVTTGLEIDPWIWFGASGKTGDVFNSGNSALPPALRSFLFKRAGLTGKKPSPGCENNVAANATYVLTLKPASIGFSQEAFGDGCELAFDVPYADLQPVLTSAGKTAIQKTIEARP